MKFSTLLLVTCATVYLPFGLHQFERSGRDPRDVEIACASCGPYFNTAALLAEAEFDNEEYVVYSTLLSGIDETKDGKPVKLSVLNDQTEDASLERCPWDSVIKSPNGTIPSDVESIIKDYKAKNKEPHKLSRALDLKINYLLVGRREFNSYFEGGRVDEGWQAFYGKYSDSSGYITFSRVGFNQSKTQALIYLDLHCGELCGVGGHIFLSKEKGEWKVIGGKLCWMS